MLARLDAGDLPLRHVQDGLDISQPLHLEGGIVQVQRLPHLHVAARDHAIDGRPNRRLAQLVFAHSQVRLLRLVVVVRGIELVRRDHLRLVHLHSPLVGRPQALQLGLRPRHLQRQPLRLQLRQRLALANGIPLLDEKRLHDAPRARHHSRFLRRGEVGRAAKVGVHHPTPHRRSGHRHGRLRVGKLPAGPGTKPGGPLLRRGPSVGASGWPRRASTVGGVRALRGLATGIRPSLRLRFRRALATASQHESQGKKRHGQRQSGVHRAPCSGVGRPRVADIICTAPGCQSVARSCGTGRAWPQCRRGILLRQRSAHCPRPMPDTEVRFTASPQAGRDVGGCP